jgi:hypothetical protein
MSFPFLGLRRPVRNTIGVLGVHGNRRPWTTTKKHQPTTDLARKAKNRGAIFLVTSQVVDALHGTRARGIRAGVSSIRIRVADDQTATHRTYYRVSKPAKSHGEGPSRSPQVNATTDRLLGTGLRISVQSPCSSS